MAPPIFDLANFKRYATLKRYLQYQDVLAPIEVAFIDAEIAIQTNGAFDR
jgi:hypothetical protein